MLADRSLEGVALDVDDLGPGIGDDAGTKPAGALDTIPKYIFQFLYRTADGVLFE